MLQEKATALGANTLLAVSFDYEVIQFKGAMLMVTCNGTAVIATKIPASET